MSTSSSAGKSIGPYALIEELGRGGAAVVWRAWDRAAGREVALKVLEGLADRHRRRFLREAEALGRIRHRNVVGVHAVGEHEGRPYLVLELVRGKTLEERLERGGPLPIAEAVDVVRKLAGGLAHVHGLGLLHRDVKPENVLMDEEGEPRLTDFGLVKDLDPDGRSKLTRTGALMGTPGYWPPELAAGGGAEVGPPADVYGLGATLFALLTGRPPFVADSLMEALRAVASDEAQRPSDLRPDVDPVLDAIVGCCLAKEPADRYDGCVALGSALEAWVPATGAGHRRLARGLLAVVASSVCVALVALLLARPREPAQAVEAPAVVATASGDDAKVPAEPVLDATARAKERLEQGRIELVSNDFDAAERLLGRALERDPTLLEGYVLRADARDGLGDKRGAFDDLSRALDLDGSRADLFEWRSRLRNALGDFPGAVDDAQRAVDLSPTGDHLVRLARAFMETHQGAARARDAVERALIAHPDHARALATRGELRWLAGDRDGRQDVERAVQIAPSDVEVRIVLGRILAFAGDLREALAEAERAVALDPRNGDTLRLRGLVRLKLGDATGALGDATAALSLTPMDLGAGLMKAEALYALGRSGQAIATMDALIASVPRPFPAWFLMRSRLRPDSQTAEIIDDATQALRLDPDLVEAYLFRAIAHQLRDEWKEALPDWTQALEREPGNREARGGRAMTRAALGDLPGAIEDWTAILEAAPFDVMARVERARVLRRHGDFTNAVKDYERAIEVLGPSDARGKEIEAELRQTRAAARPR